MQVLSQANTNGVTSTLLLTSEGTLLAFSGETNSTQSLGSAAIANNVWAVYEKIGRSTFKEDELQTIILNCEGGNAAITQVAGLLLCLYANETVPLGMLMEKTRKMAAYLEGPLKEIASS